MLTCDAQLKLNRANLLWHVVPVADPWLMYPVIALEGQPQEKLLLRIRIKKEKIEAGEKSASQVCGGWMDVA